MKPRGLAPAAPAALFLLAFMVGPLLLMLYVSTLERGAFGGVVWDAHSFVAYEKLVFERDLIGRLSVNPDYVTIST